MTISSTTAKNIYNGDGSTAIQPYTFRILNEDHIKVETKVTATDVITTLVKTTDYTVSGVGAAAGGNITLVDAAGDTPTGTQIIITRNVPLTQASDYNENDPFPAQTIEDDLDKLLMENQQQQESLDRVIKLDAGVSGVSTILPSPVATKLIGWDAAGTGLTSYSSLPSSGYTVVGSAGIGAYTDATTITLRTLTGTSNEITVDDGDGVAGVPTFSLPTALTFTGKTVTGGTFATATFSGGTFTTASFTGSLAVTGTAAAAASVTLAEDTDNGTNKITLIAPSSVAADRTVSLPDSDVNNWVVQRVSTQTGAVATGTTRIAVDDTIPQKTEGDEYMTLSITPKNTANILKIEVIAACGLSIEDHIIVALFQDTTAGALAAIIDATKAGQVGIACLTHTMAAGTVSSTTFKIRIGSASSGTVTFNGLAGARKFGGIMSSTITITEYSS